MGKILVIRGVDFSATAIEQVKLVPNKISINVLAEPINGGICTGTGVYDEGDRITITAEPNDGYIFKNWDDGDTNLVRDIIVDESKTTYVAKFLSMRPPYVKTVNGFVSRQGTISQLNGEELIAAK